ncbi:MAG: TlyA family RNA methyltransferase [Methylobacteriaceae bacterium]|nr:TlyA family RNA methyltransferase [Methylobacteriaceae bacterium]
MTRIDVALVERGLFASRAKAREAIEAGLVAIDGRKVARPSEPVTADARIEASAPYEWVSRGGVKLEAALDVFAIDPAELSCLDIGASTGGFTHVLLSRGARNVTCVDVGTGQLHPDIERDARVKNLEQTDARKLAASDLPAPPDLIVIDVSFISLDRILPHVLALAAPGARLVALVKPQFEAGPEHVRKGVVRDEKIHASVCAKIEKLVDDLGWRRIGLIASPIAGGDGNREFLIGAQRP